MIGLIIYWSIVIGLCVAGLGVSIIVGIDSALDGDYSILIFVIITYSILGLLILSCFLIKWGI